jgi:zinc protease
MKKILYPILLSILLLASCSSLPRGDSAKRETPFPYTALSERFEDPSLNSYAEANLGSFSTSVLSNGIPVVIKRNPANRVFSVKTVFMGHTVFTPFEKAGLEAVTLEMLIRGSTSRSYEEVLRILYETSSGIASQSGSYDTTSFDLNTLDQYFERLFPVYLDLLLNPVWDEKEFGQVLNDFNIVLSQSMADPYAEAVRRLHGEMFAGHPYAAEPSGTSASLKAITRDDVISYYKTLLRPERIFVVAVGNFDEEALLEDLEKSLGSLPASGTKIPEPPLYEAKKTVLISPFPDSEGIAHVRADFPLPKAGTREFRAAALGFSMLDDVLFEIVRAREGACYSVWSRAYGYKNPFGSLVVYKTAVPNRVRGLLEESIGVLLGGKCLAADTGGDGEAFVDMDKVLEFYKAKYVNAYFLSQQTNASIASQIASSIIAYGDYRAYLLLSDDVAAVTKADIVRVMEGYLRDPEASWVVLGGEDVLEGMTETNFFAERSE